MYLWEKYLSEMRKENLNENEMNAMGQLYSPI